MPPELDALADEVGDFICYWGFKKVHGRLWTHLFLAKDALDAGQLMGRLKISKALTSLSLNDLLKYEVILEHGKSNRGTQLYIANQDVLDVILNVLRARERKMLARAEISQKMLYQLGESALASARLQADRVESIGRLIGQAQNALTGLLELAHVNLQPVESLNESKTKKSTTKKSP